MKQLKLQDEAAGKQIAKFSPKEAKKRDAEADAVIAFARRMRNWDMLEDAIEKKLEDQEEFVRWWGEKVRRPGGDRDENSIVAERQQWLEVDVAEELTGIQKYQVSRWRKRLQDRPAYKAALFEHAYKKAMNIKAEEGDQAHRTAFTGNMEWFTPAEYVDRARRVLGEIDLDPASCETAQETVKAWEYFTKGNDGLTQEWRGRVWLNPPYSQPEIAQFVDKLIAEVDSGRVSSAILLTNSATDTAWFHKAMNASSAFCLTRGRIKFVSPHNEGTQPTMGQTFFYFGENHDLFAAEFSEVGGVAWVEENTRSSAAT